MVSFQRLFCLSHMYVLRETNTETNKKKDRGGKKKKKTKKKKKRVSSCL